MLKTSELVKAKIDGLKIKKRADNLNFDGLNNKKSKFNKTFVNYGDRFIPRRCQSTDEKTNKKFYADKIEKTTDVLMWDLPSNYWMQNTIIELLETAFYIKEKRILRFSEENDKCKENYSINEESFRFSRKHGEDWSCKARRKPFAYSESTHDSVGFSNCFERNMMDWSVNGQVVASFEDDVIIWKHIRDISITFHVESASCLAYCPNGRYLAIGCKVANYPVIELWDVNKYSVKVEVAWRYFFRLMTLKVECFEWSKCGKFLVAGTNKGIIYVLTVPCLKIVHKVQSSQFAISTIRFSPNMRYLASGDADGNIIIYSWSNPNLNIYLHVCWKRKTKIMLDWHPWHGVDELAIAENKPASIVILNVPNKKITSFYRRKDRSIEINSLAFNKITAELCLSVSREELNGYIESKIIVLESLSRVVDVLTIEYGARFLMWDPNGTRLVTAGADDSLTIWRFHPDIKKKFCNNSNIYNKKLKKKLFYGCDRGQIFKLWSNLR